MATMEEILQARESRSRRQAGLLSQYHLPLVSFTMNIPGPDKCAPAVMLAFSACLELLEKKFGPASVRQIRVTAAGPDASFLYRADAAQLKAGCEAIEAASPIGRLYDLDVILPDGTVLHRSQPRTCIICGAPAFFCARSRAHGLEAVQQKTQEILLTFCSEFLARQAVQVLIEEVQLTPKPGLVDRRNHGSHQDMTIDDFLNSAHSLEAYFQQAVRLGYSRDPDELKLAGIRAEQAMLQATHGVNTHRGAIYALGLLLAGFGRTILDHTPIIRAASQFAMQIPASGRGSHGQQVYARYHTGGAREEARSGFPHGVQACRLLEAGWLPLRVLLWLIAACPDTNLLYRGGIEGLIFAQQQCSRLLCLPDEELEAAAAALDDQFMYRNLSPGGCADLLSFAMLLSRIRRLTGESGYFQEGVTSIT